MSKMGSHDPFGSLKHKLWPKERSKVKLKVIKKGGRQLLKTLIRKGNNYEERHEVIRLENEVVIYEILWNGPWMTIRRIPKNPPDTNSDYSSLENIYTQVLCCYV